MRAIPFSKWDPSGNVTLFFPAMPGLARASLAAWALDGRHVGGEQAGFCERDAPRMAMAGGEFCVNATRCFGAWLAWREERAGTAPGAGARIFTARVSGWEAPVTLAVEGRAPSWRVTARLALPLRAPLEPAAGLAVTRLPGITHVLADTRLRPLPGDPRQAALGMLGEFGLMDEDAAGVIWWERREDGRLAITPVVRVRDVDTLYAENACGSGTMALALRMRILTGLTDFEVTQPSGDTLRVTLSDRPDANVDVAVSGTVNLVCEGVALVPDGLA